MADMYGVDYGIGQALAGLPEAYLRGQQIQRQTALQEQQLANEAQALDYRRLQQQQLEGAMAREAALNKLGASFAAPVPGEAELSPAQIDAARYRRAATEAPSELGREVPEYLKMAGQLETQHTARLLRDAGVSALGNDFARANAQLKASGTRLQIGPGSEPGTYSINGGPNISRSQLAITTTQLPDEHLVNSVLRMDAEASREAMAADKLRAQKEALGVRLAASRQQFEARMQAMGAGPEKLTAERKNIEARAQLLMRQGGLSYDEALSQAYDERGLADKAASKDALERRDKLTGQKIEIMKALPYLSPEEKKLAQELMADIDKELGAATIARQERLRNPKTATPTTAAPTVVPIQKIKFKSGSSTHPGLAAEGLAPSVKALLSKARQAEDGKWYVQNPNKPGEAILVP